jgi:(1->4)-alpha-D-glucan 1-alpha-D-glucosylmutase
MSRCLTPRIPVSTYRLQFNHTYTFAEAADVVPYLDALGISDIYASSYLKAVPGSLHGYDLTDPTTLNPELGSEQDYRRFAQTLKAHDMGHFVDVVPNHMGIAHSSNPWWQDVLENGPSSIYATFFDIDWHPVKQELEDKVLLPILSDLYGVVLENGDITLAYEDGAFWIHYYDHRLPISPKSYPQILTHGVERYGGQAEKDRSDLEELQHLISALHNLPARTTNPESLAERNREKERIKKELAALLAHSPGIGHFVFENVRIFNGTKGVPSSFDLLDRLLNAQAYRLAYWGVAAEEINYRRFFDINDLVAIRMEDPAVFEASHALLLRLVQDGCISGFRVDHVDGLYQPAAYLRQLQGSVMQRLGIDNGDMPLFFLVVEKILGAGETVPSDWPIHGTTGYEFLNLLNGLFVDGRAKSEFDGLYKTFTGMRLPFDEMVYEKKKLIMGASMASEINVLGHQLNRLSEKDRRTRDFTLNSLTHAIREIIACFPVYRTYVTPDSEPVTDPDQAFIRLAVTKAKRRHPTLSALVFDFVRDVLLKRWETRRSEDQEECRRFIMKFQQTTSPVTAKGIEDTVFYIYNRLASLNEVGGDPELFGIQVSSFHQQMCERQRLWPHALSATSTHDTKRSEDVRARINVLSELPRLWQSRLRLWAKLNKKFKTELDGTLAPDRNEEYLLYQTLLGAWPLESSEESAYRAFCGRIQEYMSKALHEAKVHTSWVNPNHLYDRAVQKFVEAILDRTRPNQFLEDISSLVNNIIAPCGLYNSLSQTLIKMTAPGIPDFYQGTEIWDFSLVDPDNRRPVDFQLRRRLLSELEAAQRGDRRELARSLLTTIRDGRIKLYVIMATLNYRRSHEALFGRGSYLPLEVHGEKKEHLCAFARVDGEQVVVTVVPRLIAGVLSDASQPPIGPEVWGDTSITLPTELPGDIYRMAFTGEVIRARTIAGRRQIQISDVLADFPVAFLERQP